MFTGIVEVIGKVAAIEDRPFGKRLVIDRGEWATRAGRVSHGDSIAVAGVCLTVAEISGSHLAFDVIPETLAKTSLGRLHKGGRVNLESSLTASTPMGGHAVQGHVEGLGTVAAISEAGGERRVTVETPDELAAFIIPKGAVTIDGVSLTVAAVATEPGPRFEVALIPTTIEITTLGSLKVGDAVNLETDIASRTVVHAVRQMLTQQGTPAKPGEPITMQTLRDAGFCDDDAN